MGVKCSFGKWYSPFRNHLIIFSSSLCSILLQHKIYNNNKASEIDSQFELFGNSFGGITGTW